MADADVHRSDDIEFILTNMPTTFKVRVLAIPSRVSRQLVGQNKFQIVYDLLMAEIEVALRELVAFDPAQFAQQNAAYLEVQGADEQGLNGEDKQEDAEGAA